jgi:hypothetical protein
LTQVQACHASDSTFKALDNPLLCVGEGWNVRIRDIETKFHRTLVVALAHVGAGSHLHRLSYQTTGKVLEEQAYGFSLDYGVGGTDANVLDFNFIYEEV